MTFVDCILKYFRVFHAKLGTEYVYVRNGDDLRSESWILLHRK